MSRITVPQAIDLLHRDEVVAIPTETVYGLAGRISSRHALESIFAVKQRPFFDPLIVHVRRENDALPLVKSWPKAAHVLAQEFWPGPLTLVLPKSDLVSPLITSGLETVALRSPNHPLALKILEGVGEPLAAPSANLFGRTSPTCFDHVERSFSGMLPTVDGGPCEVGLESTVLKLDSLSPNGDQVRLMLLRPGDISIDQIKAVLSAHGIATDVVSTESGRVHSPGHLEHHYQPQKPLVIVDSNIPNPKDAVNRWSVSSNCVGAISWLTLPSNPRLAARELYHKIHELDLTQSSLIAYIAPADFQSEAWSAIRDRLTRAASASLN